MRFASPCSSWVTDSIHLKYYAKFNPSKSNQDKAQARTSLKQLRQRSHAIMTLARDAFPHKLAHRQATKNRPRYNINEHKRFISRLMSLDPVLRKNYTLPSQKLNLVTLKWHPSPGLSDMRPEATCDCTTTIVINICPELDHLQRPLMRFRQIFNRKYQNGGGNMINSEVRSFTSDFTFSTPAWSAQGIVRLKNYEY